MKPKKDFNRFVSCCLILKSDHHVLLQKRKQTGYGDGYYGFVGGSVNKNEKFTQALVRIAQEKLGIHIQESDLSFESIVHIINHETQPDEVAVYFSANKYVGDIKNCQPEKYEEVRFFPLDQLPPNLFDGGALKNMQTQQLLIEIS